MQPSRVANKRWLVALLCSRQLSMGTLLLPDRACVGLSRSCAAAVPSQPAYVHNTHTAACVA